MADKERAIPPRRALSFAAGLGLAFSVVVAPALPGGAGAGAGAAAAAAAGAAAAAVGSRRDAAAAVMLSLITAGALGLYIYLFQPRELGTRRRLAMFAVLLVAWVALARLFLSVTLTDPHRLYLPYMLPVATLPMLIAGVMGEGLALAVTALLAVLTPFIGYSLPAARASLGDHPLDGLQMATVLLLGGMVGASAVHRANRMNRTLLVGGVVALVSFLSLLAFWLLNAEGRLSDIFWMVVASGANGMLSAVIGAGSIGAVGALFGIATRAQLTALGELDHPLLRRLQEQTPGTFHHSVIVGNLAEGAAHLIGADALLVRVGCYFHDIGKTAQPDFYVENQKPGAESPYKGLSPLESAQAVQNHVRAGVELARKHGLPERVCAFIPEHHGTRLVTYFYRKAAAADPATDAEAFRYPGPRPQTRETALAMLADSVEAIVRSSQDRSAKRIDALVDAVIAERVAEGQLEECDLRLRDLTAIATAFKATLRGVYHARIDYPAPAAGERSTVAAALGAPAPIAGPMDGNAPPPEPAGKLQSAGQ